MSSRRTRHRMLDVPTAHVPRRVLLLCTGLFAALLCISWSAWRQSIDRARVLPRRAGHIVRPDLGLFEMSNSTDAPHPILAVIARAQRLWQEKLDVQSKTLQAAYGEYVRRYKRRPPKGFDMFKWCQDNGVQLLDEYDQLQLDIEKYWAIDPQELQKLQSEVEKGRETFTLGKATASANMSVVAHNMSPGHMEKSGRSRANAQLALLEKVSQYFPPFRATWTTDDGKCVSPRFFATWEMKDAARKAAAVKEYIDPSTIKSPAKGWAAACPPNSALRHTDYSEPSQSDVAGYLHVTPKSFIMDLRASMNPCVNTDLVPLSTMGDHPQQPRPDRSFFPQFARAKTLLHADVLGTPLEDALSEEPDDIPWEKKKDHRLLWRGSTTGRGSSQNWDVWRNSHRMRLAELAGRTEGSVPVLLPPTNLWVIGSKIKMVPLSQLNTLMDVGLVDAVQCDPQICEKIKQDYKIKERIYPEKGKQYKYVLDVDGNSWSSRFRRLMARNALVFKSTVYPEWWTDRSMPWVHYVPIKLDYSDLYDVLVFFRGLPDGSLPGQDAMGERIATAGREWVDNFWRNEDVIAYTWRMYLEFVRVMSVDRASMDFALPP
ncbi:hypothetical protein BKA62DRAFT_821182 [Auriculariales sp. MPI-PUGE-AT-0066]|nr:hypothetical protein BKA62DRAFT_821182 [Auriculariales sp. MPI-PUGE-AT-0066]